ncbi:hypothetical protein GWK08_17935 [Leptobacterium flavescens]|uniref:DUF4252 domain-containing protein n=1 Tax=Leptobacterium flavescens TaxID=472055 RepID=A0A6P0US56_9FLAO|nr:hypothetical protein [Leptobacterium flavescens]NER15340.1 hypothetical protein [Leptobacterium flavescens]
MKLLLKPSFLLLLCLTMTSCLNVNGDKDENLSLDRDFSEVEINNEYKIKIPKYMDKTSDLNDEASLQYQNIFKETYVVIIDESKEDLISTFKDLGEYNDSLSVVENYRDIQLSSIHENIVTSYESDFRSLNINGLDAEAFEMDGRVDGVDYDIAYFLTFIEGKEKLYMLMAWTLQDRRERYKSTYEKIASSFRLYSRRKVRARSKKSS